MKPQIRAMNNNAFRSGQWAVITGISIRPAGNQKQKMSPRICFRVRFDDGAIDYCPVEDNAHEYQFNPSIQNGEMECVRSNNKDKLRELLSRCFDVIPDGEEILIADVRKELFCE